MGQEISQRKRDIENLVQKTLDRFGPPHILVNNAEHLKGRGRLRLIMTTTGSGQESSGSTWFGTYVAHQNPSSER